MIADLTTTEVVIIVSILIYATVMITKIKKNK